MSGRETVHELEVRAEVTLELPRERGGELRTVASERLAAFPFVRAAAVADLGEVDAHEDALVVTVETDLTLHFDAAPDAEGAREQLADAVAMLSSFEVLAGPYEIETW